MKTIEFDEVCPSCDGTGLYVGCCEKDGIAVVCNSCNGTGKYHYTHSYENFTERKVKSDVKRVIQTNAGIFTGEINGSIEWVGGMTYQDWLAGREFQDGMEMRQHTCPAWYYQGVDYDRKPRWKECIGCGTFSSCKNFNNKLNCWNRWDKEFGKE